jgi:hypothetical protein
LFELGTARSLVDAPPITHSGGVVEIALNQAGSPGERQLALVDKNRDLYLTNIRGSATMKRLCKLGELHFIWFFISQGEELWFYSFHCKWRKNMLFGCILASITQSENLVQNAKM